MLALMTEIRSKLEAMCLGCVSGRGNAFGLVQG